MPADENRRAHRVHRPPDRKMFVVGMKEAEGVERFRLRMLGEPFRRPERFAEAQDDANYRSHRDVIEGGSFGAQIRIELDRPWFAGCRLEYAERYGDDRGARG